VLAASGLMGTIHPARAWVWALAFVTVGAYPGTHVGRLLTESNPVG
jgi:hypothetical protein